MLDCFVTTYFNPTGNALRKKNTQEFIRNYGDHTVLLTTRDFSEEIQCRHKFVIDYSKLGFIDYILINKFIEVNKDKIRSLTYIDSDLILPSFFFNEIIQNDTPMIRQNCKTIYSTGPDSLINGKSPSHTWTLIDKKIFFGHTGMSWTWNRKFLEIINFSFPQDFLVGGFDYAMAVVCSEYLLGNIIVDGVLKNKKIYRYPSLVAFRNQIKEYNSRNKDFRLDYLPYDIIHKWHGDPDKRKTPWDSYGNSTIDTCKIIKFFNEQI